MRALLTISACAALLACERPGEEASAPRSAPDTVVAAAGVEHGETLAGPAGDAQAPVSVLTQELAYGEGPTSNLVGLLAMPEDVVEPLPGLLVIHEWWGLDDNIKAMTRRLAGEGYVALAVDLYGGATAETREQAEQLMAAVDANREAALENMRQAYEFLARYALAPKVAAVGWGMGGGWSLETALMLPDALDAMVMLSGQVSTDPARLSALDTPMLGLFGALDDVVPVRHVRVFRETLADLGKRADVHIYSDVARPFAGPDGGDFDAEIGEDAWRRTVEFLDANLR